MSNTVQNKLPESLQTLDTATLRTMIKMLQSLGLPQKHLLRALEVEVVKRERIQ